METAAVRVANSSAPLLTNSSTEARSDSAIAPSCSATGHGSRTLTVGPIASRSTGEACACWRLTSSAAYPVTTRGSPKPMRIVSSALAPAIDGFQANAMPVSMTVGSPGIAIRSRAW